MSLTRRAFLLVLVIQLLGLGLLALDGWKLQSSVHQEQLHSEKVVELAELLRLQDAFSDFFMTVDQLRRKPDTDIVRLSLVESSHIIELMDGLETDRTSATQAELLASLRAQYWGIGQALSLLAGREMEHRDELTNAAVTAVYSSTYQLQDLIRSLQDKLHDDERLRERDLRNQRQAVFLGMGLWLLLTSILGILYNRITLRPWRELAKLRPGRINLEELERLEYSNIPELVAIGHTLGRLVQGRNKLHLRHQQEVDLLNRQLAESNRVRNDFLAGISHEIRTPMNNLVGNLELLDASLGEQEDRRLILSIQRAVDDLLAVINDLLAFSRLENEALELNPIEFDLAQVVEAICDTHTHLAYEKSLDFVCILEAGLPEMVRGDAGRLRQVLNNLVGNAVKFTETGHVEVRVSQMHHTDRQCTVCFEISDTGIGIAPDRLAHLFEPFVQAEGSMSRSHEGLGLGLSISRRLVELLGGRITVRSQPGRGSVFTFKIQLDIMRALRAADATSPPLLLVENHAGLCEAVHACCSDLGSRSTDVDDLGSAIELLRYPDGEDWNRAVVLLSLGAIQNADRALVDEFIRALPERSTLALLVHDAVELQPLLALLPPTQAVIRRPIRRTAVRALLDNKRTSGIMGLRWVENLALETDSTTSGSPTPASEPAAPPARGASPWDSWRILAVDDNPVNLKLLQNLLEKRGYQLLTADDGETALQVLEHETVDLVLMDCMMPRLDGLSATRRFREREKGRWTRVIALTANAVGGDRERCIAAGMDDYLEKPVRRAALYSMLDRYLPPREMPDEIPEPALSTPVVKAVDVQRSEEAVIAQETAKEPDRLNLKVIQDDSDGDHEFESQLIQLFIRDARRRMGSLEQAIGDGNAGTVHLEAHTVKGICAGIGAMAMCQLAYELEQRSSSGNLAGAGELLDSLRAEYGYVEQQLDAYLQLQADGE
ncbi:MAG: response regulator [Candidatus Delongbacteria bacterium]|nr:response regulator [Candidatus Delongbacteria bacterium]